MFSVTEVRNGVRTVLQKVTIGDSQNVRITVQGDTIMAYTGATSATAGGAAVLTQKTTYLQTDANATYFGLGFVRTGYWIPSFIFHGL